MLEKNYKIICPYCFHEFQHDEVHFRLETIKDFSYSESEIERMPPSQRKLDLMTEFKKVKFFLVGEDSKYQKFWSKFGSTTETSTNSEKQRFNCEVYQLPVIDPNSEEAESCLKVQKRDYDGNPDYFIYDADGMVVAVEDIEGAKTKRRVCPECHNPLPLGYGKNNTKFISVIGVTRAGKTVYLSQLLKNMSLYAGYVQLYACLSDDHVSNFIRDNPVEMNTPLPNPTMIGRLTQPMSYDIIQDNNGNKRTDTIVIYDIAGESCTNASAMLAYADFVIHSDGIMLLIDPEQLGLSQNDNLDDDAKAAQPQLVLDTIHNAFLSGDSVKKCSIPMAICISKSDTFEGLLSDVGRRDISPIRDSFSGRYSPVFNASDYNILEAEICQILQGTTLDTALHNAFDNYNYFIFSATGCPVEKKLLDGEIEPRSYPIEPPIPRRIAEPILWLFKKFNFIKADTPILLPAPRPLPNGGRVEVKLTLFDKLKGKPAFREMTPEEKAKYRYEPTI